MPYRHPRGSCGEDVSDDDMDWCQVQPQPAAQSVRNQIEAQGHVAGVGDVGGGLAQSQAA